MSQPEDSSFLFHDSWLISMSMESLWERANDEIKNLSLPIQRQTREEDASLRRDHIAKRGEKFSSRFTELELGLLEIFRVDFSERAHATFWRFTSSVYTTSRASKLLHVARLQRLIISSAWYRTIFLRRKLNDFVHFYFFLNASI